jgi:uracil-DNA glycosylase
LPRPLDPATREALAERMRFYRDLGLTEFYRRPVAELGATGLDSETAEAGSVAEELAEREALSRAAMADATQSEGAPGLGSSRTGPGPSGGDPSHSGTGERKSIQADSSAQPNFFQEDPAIKTRKAVAAPPPALNVIPLADRAAALQAIREDIGDCTRCALHKGRHTIVFADGSPTARLMFVGEGPGADEDAQGLPFVGRAGQLLNNMIAAMGLKREECYIANIVKCRPPGNRTPEPAEANTCSPFLFRQIDVVRPQVLVALGATAATYLLGARQPLAALRGRIHAFRGMSLIVTYHPAFLLRDPRQKKEAWADLQIAMRELGLKAPARG